jgi:sporulation protein YlmC with PRC-barrel domain
MPAQFTIGDRASASDGFCGEVVRLIFDPGSRAVTHLVIRPKHRHAAGRLVPLDLVAEAAGEIRLRCTLAEFGQLQPAEETEQVGESSNWGGYDAGQPVEGFSSTGSFGIGGPVTSVNSGMSPGRAPKVILADVVPLGETEVSRGDHVYALDGRVGQVEGFAVDPGSGRVTHVLLQKGHLWGHHEVAIPIDAVAEVGDGVRLNVTKQQMEGWRLEGDR